MKFNQDGTEVQLEGDIENNKVSIDTANIDFIITILSTNLYSNPIQSFLRETVSNGWDSHVEAGIDEPVILEIGTSSEGQNYCKIQDFGVGLSPERFNQVYKNIGSSTKRNNNDQIGGFGIGRFSALAYSEMVNITSIYDGIEYSYVMYKDGNSISIDLLNKIETNNRNGVSVQVNIKKGDTYNFVKAIMSQLPFFENLYVDYSNYQTGSDSYGAFSSVIVEGLEKFNKSMIKKYRDFYVTSLETPIEYPIKDRVKLLLGKVVYPLRLEELKLKSNNGLDFTKYPICLKFDIGELQVTPNREEVLYTDKNIATITKRLQGALDEIQQMIFDKSDKDYDNVTGYVNAINNNIIITLLDMGGDGDIYISTYNSASRATLNGISYDKKNFLGMYNAMMSASILPISFTLQQGKMIKGSIGYTNTVNLANIKSNFKKHYFSRQSDLGNYTKAWIRETFRDGDTFILPVKYVKSTIARYMKEVIARSDSSQKYGNNKFKFDSKIFKIIARSFISNIQKIPLIDDSSVPASFIDKKKADMKMKRANVSKSLVDWKQNMNLYPLKESDVHYFKMVPKPKLISLGDLKKEYRTLVVYDEKNSETLRHLASGLINTKIVFTEVAPTKMKLLSNLDNFIKLEDFMADPNYKAIRNVATAKKIKDTFPQLALLKNIKNLDKISVRLSESVDRLYQFEQKYLSRFILTDKEDKAILEEICNICEEKRYYNFEILGVLHSSKRMIENAMFLTEFNSYNDNYNIPTGQIPIILDYVLARKLFLPNVEVLNEIKNAK